MYKILGALLALPFLAAPAAAQCCMPFAKSYSGNVGFSLNLGYWANCMSGMPGGGPGGGGQPMPAQLGPWYRRFLGSGMRWDADNAEAVRGLEALSQSDQWNEYWQRQLRPTG